MQLLERTQFLLKKAQKLVDFIEHNGEIDRGERDLMLNYLRELNDAFAADTEFLSVASANNPRTAILPQAAAEMPSNIPDVPPPTAAADYPEVAFTQISDDDNAVAEPSPPKQATYNWNTLIETAENFLEQHPPPRKTPPPVEMPPIATYTDVTDDEMPLVLPAKTPESLVSEPVDVNTIFDIKAGSDLGSDKPIKDFRMAFGINERIFNINELFGGSASVYDAVLNELNSMNDFEAAKNYLQTKIVDEYSWTKPEKIKKAQWFVRLLWRRFLV